MDDGMVLVHHGVKGMKWGVRRSPTQLGHPTSARKTLISTKKPQSPFGAKTEWTEKKRRKRSEDSKTANDIRKKRIGEMSNKDLEILIKRMNLEQQYKRLNPSKVKKAMVAVATVAGFLGTMSSLYNNYNNVIGIGKKISSSFDSLIMADLQKAFDDYRVD